MKSVYLKNMTNELYDKRGTAFLYSSSHLFYSSSENCYILFEHKVKIIKYISNFRPESTKYMSTNKFGVAIWMLKLENFSSTQQCYKGKNDFESAEIPPE